MTALEVVALVERIQEASRIARGNMEPSSCHPEKFGMPCRCPGCIARCGHYAKEYAAEAFHEVNVLIEALRTSGGR